MAELKEKVLSLCIPTNGIEEWVFPVLESIFNQGVDETLYEVVVTDNGDNNDFFLKMTEYAKKHNNLIYKKNNAYMFHNQLEALKYAEGIYLKFINHRCLLPEGVLQYMIDMIKKNADEKPVIFFSNKSLEKNIYYLNSFDEFVCTLGKYVSWTGGVGIWREDYNRIPADVKVDKISPHSCILFSERKKKKYIIDNIEIARELDTDHGKKGKYDLFKAFAVEEPMISLNLLIDGDISAKTFKKIKQDYKDFIITLYNDFIVEKNDCSYILDGFDDAMGVFFTKDEIIKGVKKLRINKKISKIKRIPNKIVGITKRIRVK